MPGRPLILLVVGVALLAACSTTRNTDETVAGAEQPSQDTAVFPLTGDEALVVILEAVADGWPDKVPGPLKDGRPGYEFTLEFDINQERIFVELIEAPGGYGFRVTNKGTAPVVGIPAREKLALLLDAYAREASIQPSSK